MSDSSESIAPAVNVVPGIDVPDAEFHQVDLGRKHIATVIDEEIQTVDIEADHEKVDSLYKEEQLVNVKRVVLRRRRLINCIVVVIGLLVFIILMTTLGKEKDEAMTKKDLSNDAKDPVLYGKSNASDTSESFIPQFACANTINSCPEYANGTWTKLPQDILGESHKDYAGFATALSCDGSILAVSSIYNNNKTGHVRVFKWENEVLSWSKMGNDIEGTSPGEDFGYSLTMSADGYTIAVGSHRNSDVAEGAGEVRVLTYFDHVWTPLGQDIQGESAGDLSGHSISLSMDGSRIAIGASRNNGTASGAGHARIFEIVEVNGNLQWVQIGQDLDGAALGDQFGRSVSLSGDGKRVAIGGNTYDVADDILDAGHVRVFEYDGSTKTWMSVSAAINGQKSDEYFGTAVSLSYDGSRLAVGSPNSKAYIFGITRVYQLSDDGWSQLGSNLYGGGNTIDLNLDGNRVVIGSKGNFANGIDSGHLSVHEYDMTISTWLQVGGDINGNEGENSATSVAISADGKRVVSSSPSSGTINGTDDNGIVRVYDFC